MKVTVVIPCYNGSSTLGRQLRALASQETDATFEVLVADNGSNDDPGAVVTGFDQRFRLVDASSVRGINHARNRGVAEGVGDAFLFCDADDEVHPGWLQAHHEALSAGAALTGGTLRRVTAGGEELSWQLFLNNWLDYLPWPTGANCGVARHVFEQCGHFDEDLRGGGDETDFFWRAQIAGHELVLVTGASIDYVARDAPGAVFSQNVGFGRSHVRLHDRFGPHGMPQPSGRDALRNLARESLRAVRHPSDPAARRRVVGVAGQMAGRALQARDRRT